LVLRKEDRAENMERVPGGGKREKGAAAGFARAVGGATALDRINRTEQD